MALFSAWLAVPALHVVVLSWLAPVGRMREPVHFDYRAPAGCPDAATFVGQVQWRTQRFRVAEQGETARRLLVNVNQRGARGNVSGRLTLRQLDGRESVRKVAGRSCDEIVDALALIAALAIDPRAMTWPPATTWPQEPAPPVSSAPPGGMPTVSVRVEPLAQPDRAWWLRVGAHVGAIVGVGPDVLIYPSAFVEIAKFRQSRVPPLAARVGFARATDQVTRAPGAATFTWTVALAEACAPVPLAARLSFQPCGHFMIGVLRGAGEDLPNAWQVDRPWASVGVTAGLRWQISQRLAVEIENALGAALVRDRFVFEPNVTVHEVPAVHGTIRGGLAWALW